MITEIMGKSERDVENPYLLIFPKVGLPKLVDVLVTTCSKDCEVFPAF